MTAILFIIVLAILIFVHELGHFIAAKTSNVRVDAFALGFPPKLFSWKPKNSETTYSLNLIPFGGYVSIFGEDPNEESLGGPDKDRALTSKSKPRQIWMLAAGVIFNILFAWILISVGFMIGFPVSQEAGLVDELENPALTLVVVLPESPAAESGLLSGDRIVEIKSGEETLVGSETTVKEAQTFITSSDELSVTYERAEVIETVAVVPEEGILANSKAIGVSLDVVGIAQLPMHRAVWEGSKLTVNLTRSIAVGLSGFVSDAFTGKADFSQVAGPVGIAGLVGNASRLGFVYLLSFTALISLHLAIINLVPFPALDGGRILFIIIEAIKGSPIKPKIANTLNIAGFALLILLMVLVTYNDIVRLF